MRILIITSCTGEKAVSHEKAPTLEDFQKGPKHIAKLEKTLAKLMTPARDLYTGQQHVRLMRGVGALSEARKTDKNLPEIDLYVLSAGYGLIRGSKKILPYEATFAGMKKAELRAWADALKVPAAIRRVLAKSYDLALILLGDNYLAACDLDSEVEFGGPTIFMCGANQAKKLPGWAGVNVVPLGNPEAKRFSCSLVGLKGELASFLLQGVAKKKVALKQLAKPNVDLLSLFEQAETPNARRAAARANPSVDRVIQLPKTWSDKLHRGKLRYFIPEWDDLVDPDYDFENDAHSGGTGDWSNQVYAHQMYPEPNYDGILVSKVVAEASKKKKERINKLGVHRFLRVPREFPIMGDCGAFGYIDQDVPPYSTNEILDYYTRLDFDLGVSVDHLIVTATEAQKRERYQLTISNAEEFLKEHRKLGLPWKPIGAVQGWDPKSYAQAAKQYVDMGYDYIALGGLVRSSTKEILQVLHEVHKVVPDRVSMHLFGLARLNALQEFARLGVDSVDSASYLRQAWMRTKQSYLLPDGVSYAALRIPEVGKSFRAKRMLENPELTDGVIKKLERNALIAVRAYAAGNGKLDTALNALMEFDRFVTVQREDLEPHYRRTLEEKPWEKCGCNICKQWGVEVAIFRGNNRNRRRGFHNTYAFYRLLQRSLSAEPSGDNLNITQPDLFDALEAIG